MSKITKYSQLDLTGQKFARLIALGRALGPRRNYWLCDCECGTATVVYAGRLISGHTRSCGCLISELSAARARAYAETHRHDLTGQRFSKLTALMPLPSGKWLCRCDCGREAVAHSTYLRNGHIKTCGCSRGPYGTYGRLVGTPEHRAYERARKRCRNDKRYKARGIEFKFDTLEQFSAEVGPCPGPDYSIDRIDNNRGYEPGNVRWATRVEQGSNKRNNRLITAFGQTKTVTEWQRKTGLPVYARLHWENIDEALTLPRQSRPYQRVRSGAKKAA